jgi:hypothetical protein
MPGNAFRAVVSHAGKSFYKRESSEMWLCWIYTNCSLSPRNAPLPAGTYFL